MQGYTYIARIKENSKITISKKNTGNRFAIFTAEEKIAVDVNLKQITIQNESDIKEYSFNNANGKWLFFGYYRGTDVEEAEKAGENVQIEIGDKTDYEEHKEQKIVLDIQQEMLTEDYFDLDRKKEVHTWEKYEITGNENWSIAKAGTANYFYQFTIKDKLNKVNQDVLPFSNCYKSALVVTINTEKGVFVTIDGTIRIREEKEGTIEEFKAKLQALYNAGNAVEVWYKLVEAETTELALTEAQIQQLEQLNKLRFYKNVNNIYTAEDIALLQATYSVDIQTKLNAINNQILNLGGN